MKAFKMQQNFKRDNFDIVFLEKEKRPSAQYLSVEVEPGNRLDDHGIALCEIEGRHYSHPVFRAEIALTYLNEFETNANPSGLIEAEKYAKAILDSGKHINDALFFPYEFDYFLHGIKKEEEKMRAPWYSGMGQGEILSLFSRLYLLTNKESYLKAADQVFLSLLRLKGRSDPWVSAIDKNDYLWLEEYPTEPLSHALNGFIYGVFGLYDYYTVTKKTEVLALLEGYLTTIKHYLTDFRKVDDYSYYCLKHKKQSEFYHEVHIRQLIWLYQITNDKYFHEMANLFKKDGQNAKMLWNKIKRVIKKFLILNF